MTLGSNNEALAIHSELTAILCLPASCCVFSLMHFWYSYELNLAAIFVHFTHKYWLLLNYVNFLIKSNLIC